MANFRTRLIPMIKLYRLLMKFDYVFPMLSMHIQILRLEL